MRVLPTWEPEEKPYFTDPSPEVDRNWHEMFECKPIQIIESARCMLIVKLVDHNLGISPERMKDMGRIDQGIELPDGRYYGTIMAFHHLHCLVSNSAFTMKTEPSSNNQNRKVFTELCIPNTMGLTSCRPSGK